LESAPQLRDAGRLALFAATPVPKATGLAVRSDADESRRIIHENARRLCGPRAPAARATGQPFATPCLDARSQPWWSLNCHALAALLGASMAAPWIDNGSHYRGIAALFAFD
jgi:hypothetical protein